MECFTYTYKRLLDFGRLRKAGLQVCKICIVSTAMLFSACSIRKQSHGRMQSYYNHEPHSRCARLWLTWSRGGGITGTCGRPVFRRIGYSAVILKRGNYYFATCTELYTDDVLCFFCFQNSCEARFCWSSSVSSTILFDAGL